MTFKKTNTSEYFTSIFNSTLISSTFVFVITLAIFSGVLTADFVQWDDNIIIYLNPNIGKLNLDRIVWAFTDVDSMMRYNPLTLLSWCATYHLFGFNPYGYHLGNLILHSLSSVFLFFIIRILLSVIHEKRKGAGTLQEWRINVIAVIPTLLWALHPMRVEPVAWATDRTYCQAIFFLMISTVFYLKAKMAVPSTNRYKILIGVSLGSYVLSLLSYAIGISYFLVFLLIDYTVFYNRDKPYNHFLRSGRFKNLLIEKFLFAIPAISIGLITVIVRIKSAGMWSPPVSLSDFNMFSRFMQAIYVLVYYLYRPFYPLDLMPVYTTLVSFNPGSLLSVLHALIFIIILIIIMIFRKRCQICFPFFLAHIILLIPVLGIFEHPHYPVDRYSYLSSIWFSVFIAFVLIQLVKRKYFIGLSILLMVVVLTLGGLSVQQVKVWHNSETLFKHMIKTLDDDPYVQDIYWRLGVYFYQNKRTNEAAGFLWKTLKINPTHLVSHKLLGVIAFEKRDFKRAKYHFQMVLKINKSDPQARYYLKQIEEDASMETS